MKQWLMERNKTLDHIFSLLGSMALSEAIDELETFGAAHPELSLDARLREIRSDYRLMFDYWSKGFKDEQLELVYRNFIYRMYRLTADVGMRYAIAHSSYLTAIDNRVRSAGRDWSPAALQAGLEGFVSDVALLELEPAHVRAERKLGLHRAHRQMMNDLFDYIWTSSQWTDSTAESMAQLLLAPTVDTIDQQLIVSAVMLGCMNMFDINKFRVMLTVYRQSSDEQVRQRALVGWALSAGVGMHHIFPEEREMVGGLLADEHVCKELVELQIQLFYCLSAENDNRKIQQEIMPDLLKHNGLSITPNGIEEKEGDSIEDIIHPEEAERRMEKVEESFRRMLDMQKSGADIYFGGFSQMKRFPFFDSIGNWFVPFYPEHPAISQAYGTQADTRMIRNIVDHMPFCNSDKYSFVIAFRQVVDRIPQNIREMLANGSVAGMEAVAAEEQGKPEYIRRQYLQDLYRFFRLYPSRSMLYNPFGHDADGHVFNYVFFANPIFSATSLEACYGEVVGCMMKRSMYREAASVLANCSVPGRDFLYYMHCGSLRLHHPAASGGLALPYASACFEEALRLRPDSAKALSGYARAKFYDGEYAVAEDAYARLSAMHPERKSSVLNMAVCMVNLGKSDEALKHLYKLNYESPDDDRVNRVMARALVCAGQYDKAEKAYLALCAGQEAEPEDHLNHGLCRWLAGDKAGAAECFVEYVRAHGGDAGVAGCRSLFYADVADKERELLAGNGITPTEVHLMCDLVCDLAFRIR